MYIFEFNIKMHIVTENHKFLFRIRYLQTVKKFSLGTYFICFLFLLKHVPSRVEYYVDISTH